jgi:hypothetical protein
LDLQFNVGRCAVAFFPSLAKRRISRLVTSFLLLWNFAEKNSSSWLGCSHALPVHGGFRAVIGLVDVGIGTSIALLVFFIEGFPVIFEDGRCEGVVMTVL